MKIKTNKTSSYNLFGGVLLLLLLLLLFFKYAQTAGDHAPKNKVTQQLDIEKRTVLKEKKASSNKSMAELEQFVFSVKQKDYMAIGQTRNAAVERGLLSEQNPALYKTTIFPDGKKLKGEIRLKGDWADHLRDPKKWSYRIIMKGEETYRGMRKFSIQHPKTRNYLWEWFFHKVIKEHDIIGLRYDFVAVEMQVKEKDSNTKRIPMGIMALEESFDKILIENNKRREGVIIAVDESLFWNDVKKQHEMKLDDNARDWKLLDPRTPPIRVFNENKVLASEKLSKQFEVARSLLQQYRDGKLKISEVFDVEKLSLFVALANLFGSHHGLAWHNVRMYYNPITNKLEPIAFDSDAGQKIAKIKHYPYYDVEDELYEQKLMEKLELVSSTEFVQELVDFYQEDLSQLGNTLTKEFKEAKPNIDFSILTYNSNFIKKYIHPYDVIKASFIELEKENIILEVKNISDFPVRINSLDLENGKVLNDFISDNKIEGGGKKKISFPLKDAFSNAFVSKKNKEGGFRYPKDLRKIKVNFNTIGMRHKRLEKIIPYDLNVNEQLISDYKNSFKANFDAVDFISVNYEDKVIQFKPGKYNITEPVLIPKGYTVMVAAGFELDLLKGASLTSYAPVICKGTKEAPIIFRSSDASGQGIFVSNTAKKSILEHCQFINLSNPETENWALSGAVNFHEADVSITNAVFKDNRCEDGLNIIRSKFSLENSTFENTFSDAFDGDFVTGNISSCKFKNLGNDGVDVSGSTIEINDLILENPSDKAISAGESSIIKGNNVQISGGEIGLVSKDLSKISISQITITDTRLAFSCFQKKSEYGPGVIDVKQVSLTNVELDYLVEYASELMIDDVAAAVKVENVTDKMYGHDYGKSSR